MFSVDYYNNCLWSVTVHYLRQSSFVFLNCYFFHAIVWRSVRLPSFQLLFFFYTVFSFSLFPSHAFFLPLSRHVRETIIIMMIFFSLVRFSCRTTSGQFVCYLLYLVCILCQFSCCLMSFEFYLSIPIFMLQWEIRNVF